MLVHKWQPTISCSRIYYPKIKNTMKYFELYLVNSILHILNQYLYYTSTVYSYCCLTLFILLAISRVYFLIYIYQYCFTQTTSFGTLNRELFFMYNYMCVCMCVYPNLFGSGRFEDKQRIYWKNQKDWLTHTHVYTEFFFLLKWFIHKNHLVVLSVKFMPDIPNFLLNICLCVCGRVLYGWEWFCIVMLRDFFFLL